MRSAAIATIGVAVGGVAPAAIAQAGSPASDPQLDPSYQPPASAPAGGAASAPASTPAGTPAPSGLPPHPATVMTPVDPDSPVMVAPPPGWQLVRPIFLNGRLYYAVADAEAYLSQAGWTRPAQVFEKESTGFRFDLIEVPRFARGSVARGTYVGYGTSVSLSTGGGVRLGYGPGATHRYLGGYGYHRRRGDNAYTGGFAGPIDGQLSPGYVPAPPQEPEVVELTLLEQAGLELAYGDPGRGAELYARYLEDDPENAEVMRSMAVAMFAGGREEDGVALMRLAYVTDPGLAGDPLGDWITGGDSRAMRELQIATVRYANRVQSASARLTAAVLMQARGLPEPAIKQLDLARDVGLSEEVELRLRAELTRGP